MIVLSHFCFEDFFFFQAWDNNVVFHQIKKKKICLSSSPFSHMLLCHAFPSCKGHFQLPIIDQELELELKSSLIQKSEVPALQNIMVW